MAVSPIAIVGRACVLPGALSPQELGDAVLAGRDLVSSTPADRWGLSRGDVMCAPPGAPTTGLLPHTGDRCWADRGGYVSGFESVWDPAGFAVPARELAGLDPLFLWTLHTAREALAGCQRPAGARVQAIFGNLGFPAGLMARFAEASWLSAVPGYGPAAMAAAGLVRPDPRNRFMMGGPAALLRQALGLDGAFALDAACASSLYALKLGCDRLRDGQADLVLAGAVNRSDDLFIHVGFCALSALSKSGQSRPFHAEADGLVPAEGAGFLALKRLDDALRAGDEIHGVIRGVGLSNDGRGRGFLAPAAEGQVRAMRAAWDEAGLDPASVGLVECHATGTSVGDGTELNSMGQVFGQARDLPIGSLKSNLGHLITAAGVAGIIKLTEAMKRGLRPPTLHVERPHPMLGEGPFRPVLAAEDWAGPRRGAVSAFGFGGNNAHVVLDQLPSPGWEPALRPAASEQADLAVVALGAVVGPAADAASWAARLLQGQSLVQDGQARTETVELSLAGLRFPPRDLEQTLPQQLLVLAAAREAVESLPLALPRERSAVLVGMEADPLVARYGMRWRLASWGRSWRAPEGWLAQARAGVVPELGSAGVVGTMPNIPANRLNSQLDLGGPSLVVCDGAASGLQALELAARALRAGELDAAVVGAVDLSCEPAHEAAVAALLPADRQLPGDAAVVLVLQRLADATAAGLPILAVLPGRPDAAPTLRLGTDPGSHSLVPTHGYAHAAAGMVHLGAAVLALATGSRPDGGTGAAQTARVSVDGHTVDLRAAPKPAAPKPPARSGPQLRLAAHWPAPSWPPLPTASWLAAPQVAAPPPEIAMAPSAPPAAAAAGAQAMAPAPALPPVMGAPTVDLRPPYVGAAVAPAASAPAQVPPAAAPSALAAPAVAAAIPHAPRGADDVIAAQAASLRALHEQYLSSQAEVHARFLQVRQHAMFALLQQGGMASAALAAPAHTAPAHTASARPVPAPAPFVAPPAPPAPLPPRPAAAAPLPAVPLPAVPLPTVPLPAAPLPAAAKPPVAAPAPAPAAPGMRRPPTGPTLDRAGLQIHASGEISRVYGPLFTRQDGYTRQCRMPEPPLLLADRMTGLDAEPGSMGKGTIWTETDVQSDSWYLNEGRMPAGIMIESGQADLMLISYLGIDWLNQGERVYRLLGCQLTYHRDLPAPGETLQYDIHVDGHARHGDVRLFFFHYDCEINGQPALTVRQGQAGFFTDDELADSAGILWKPEDQEIVPAPRLDPPVVDSGLRAYSGEQIRAFATGRPWDCFGDAFRMSETHNRTPKIQSGHMLFLHEIPVLDPAGGPWGRGYLRAVQHLHDDDWFYKGHFKNDPCMPGTLMFEGCAQAMSFYMAAMGVTLQRDGWRFQPVKGEMFDLRCRGQAIPGNRELIYEVFVEEFVAGPVPTLYADLLCTIDGLKAFHARRVGIELVADWPITSMPELWKAVPPGAPADQGSRPVATLADGFRFDYDSLLACAWGRPSDAFGAMYARFDGHRRVARLPGPPYHFMSRVTQLEGLPPQTLVNGPLVPGARVVLEFDVDPEAWYFAENGTETMPFCVFLEAALQPCGWLASYVGSALTVDRDLSFRNLDGTATWTQELPRNAGTLKTRVEITQISKTAGMIIEGFDVTCHLDDADGGERQVYAMKTVFGFFPKEALENQVGLPTTPEQRAVLSLDSAFSLDLTDSPARYCDAEPRLARPMLRMLDRVTGWWPQGGKVNLGMVRGEKDVHAGEWFFKAHFFQDPVQPGSLGMEALLQLLQVVMLEQGMGTGPGARFEPLMIGRPVTWKYRGQVVPTNRVIQSTMEIVEVGEDEHGPFVIGDGSLWVDGKRIYEVQGMGMRVVTTPLPPGDEIEVQTDPNSTEPVAEGLQADIHLDPQVDTWITDHCPTWTVPSLPMTVVADLLARPVAAAGRTVIGMGEVKLKRWIRVEGPLALQARVVASRPGAATVHLFQGEEVLATGQVRFGPYPKAPRARSSVSGPDAGDPYAQGRLFHGPAFHLVRRLVLGDAGASATLQVPAGAAPAGVLHPALLDGATHPIPHDELGRWFPELDPGKVAYPASIHNLTVFGPGPAPDATVRCEVRPAGTLGSPDLPLFELELSTVDGVWAQLTLLEACYPKGPLGRAVPAERRAFLRDRRFVPGLRLSRFDGHTTRLTEAEVAASDWLPGTIQAVYGTRDAAELARREHLAHKVGVHPGVVDQALPLNEILLDPREHKGELQVRDGGVERLDLAPIEAFWTDWFAMGERWPVEDLYYGLMRRFLRRVVLPEPQALAAVRGRPLLYLANHQVGVESLLFSILASGLNGVPTVTVAKAEHRATWLGTLIQHCFRYPEVHDPKVITYFEREDKASLVGIIRDLATGLVTPQQGKGGTKAAGQSVMVHVEGTRALSCRSRVEKMSGAFIDMALQTGTPIVPVRFTGGLPVQPLTTRLEFPVGLGTQDVWLGRPMLPEELVGVPYGERKKRVVAAINGLGPEASVEEPHEGDPGLEEAVAAWMERSGATHEDAVLYRVLAEQSQVSEDMAWMLSAIARGEPLEEEDPRSAWLGALRRRLDPVGGRRDRP